MDQESILQRKQTKINKYNIPQNSKRVDQNYKVGDKVMLTNNDAFKYETPYNTPFVITKCWTNGTVTLRYGTIKISHTTHHIKPYKSDTKIEYIRPENMYDGVKIQSPVI